MSYLYLAIKVEQDKHNEYSVFCRKFRKTMTKNGGEPINKDKVTACPEREYKK